MWYTWRSCQYPKLTLHLRQEGVGFVIHSEPAPPSTSSASALLISSSIRYPNVNCIYPRKRYSASCWMNESCVLLMILIRINLPILYLFCYSIVRLLETVYTKTKSLSLAFDFAALNYAHAGVLYPYANYHKSNACYLLTRFWYL